MLSTGVSGMARTRDESGAKTVTGLCMYHCNGNGCFYQAIVKDKKLLRLDVHPKWKTPLCVRIWPTKERLYAPERLRYPLRRVGERGEKKWQRISWDEALDTVAEQLNSIKAKYGNEALVLWHNESNYGPPGALNAINNTSYRLFSLWGGFVPAYRRGSHCWQAYIHAMNNLFGTTAVIGPPLSESELVVLWASNPAGTSGRNSDVFDAKEKGIKFVVIDPVFTRSVAQLADEWVPIRPATDLALALAMIRIILAERLYDEDFLLQHTNAPFLVREDNGQLLREKDVRDGGEGSFVVWDRNSGSYKPHDEPGVVGSLEGNYSVSGTSCRTVMQKVEELVREWTPERASVVTGVPADTIVRLSRLIGRSKNVAVPSGTPAYNRSTHWGENTSYAVGMLRALTGNIRGAAKRAFTDPGGGPFGPVGILRTVYSQRERNPVRATFPIQRLGEAILHPETYGTNLKAAYFMLGNPVNQSPDGNKIIEGLKALDFIVVADTWMTATAQYADIVLPVSMGLERTIIQELRRDDEFYLVYQEAALEPEGECRDDFDLICDLARRMGFADAFPWHDAKEWVADQLNKARSDPQYPWLKDITFDRLRKEGVVKIDLPPLPELQPTWELRTPSKKIELYNESLLNRGYDPVPVYREALESPVSTPELFQKYPLILVSPKWSFSSNSSLSGTPTLLEFGKPGVLLNTKDAGARGIKDGELVKVFNDRAEVETRAWVAETIMPGVARMFAGVWPEQGNPNLLNGDLPTTYGETAVYNCLVQVEKKG